MRKTRKQMVGEAEDVEREARETGYHGLANELHQRWQWQRQSQHGEHFAVPA